MVRKIGLMIIQLQIEFLAAQKGHYVEKFSEGHKGRQQVLVVRVVHDHLDVRAPAFVDAVLLEENKAMKAA